MLGLIQKVSTNLFFRLLYLFGTPPWDSGITPPEVEDFIQTHPPGRAIDLGCGTGTNAITLAQHGWQVRGVDFVPRAIHQARAKARKAGLDLPFFTGSVTDPALFDSPYDLILDIGCYHVLNPAEREQYRQNIASHLAPGGTFMLYAFTPHADSASNTFTLDDQTAFEALLTLEQRIDSADTPTRTSAWLWFKKLKGTQ